MKKLTQDEEDFYFILGEDPGGFNTVGAIMIGILLVLTLLGLTALFIYLAFIYLS